MATAMGKRLSGKTVLITGASSGIGKSTALEFARTSPSSLKLILTARRIDSLKALAAEITKEVGEGVQVLPVQLDVSKPDQVRGFVQGLPEEYRHIDVLVNNAGMVQGIDKVGDIKENDVDAMMATNVTGLINMTQTVLQIMKKRDKGDIINIGSIAGREGYPGGAIYCATKAAVRIFTEAMRKELIATRIRVIEIDPGQVETEFSVVRFYGDKSKADAVYKGVTPLTPEDIAETIVFAAGRPENVIIADVLVFPNHQVSRLSPRSVVKVVTDCVRRRPPQSCTDESSCSYADSNCLLGCCNCHAQEASRTGFEDVDRPTIFIIAPYGCHIAISSTLKDPAAACRWSSSPRDRCVHWLPH